MPYKYDQATHSLIQLPEMKEPNVNVEKYNDYGIVMTVFNSTLFNKDCEKYRKHLASLKTYPVGVEKVPDYWKVEGQILGDKDFKIGCQITPCHCKDAEKCEHPVATPKWFPLNTDRPKTYA